MIISIFELRKEFFSVPLYYCKGQTRDIREIGRILGALDLAATFVRKWGNLAKSYRF
jgi:hypothetical protein